MVIVGGKVVTGGLYRENGVDIRLNSDFPYYVEANSECVGWGGPEIMWFEVDMEGEYTQGEDAADWYELLRFDNLEEAKALADKVLLEKNLQARVCCDFENVYVTRPARFKRGSEEQSVLDWIVVEVGKVGKISVDLLVEIGKSYFLPTKGEEEDCISFLRNGVWEANTEHYAFDVLKRDAFVEIDKNDTISLSEFGLFRLKEIHGLGRSKL